MFLTAEEVDTFTKEQCETHIKKLAKTYNLNKPITECWTEVWDDLDNITNTLLYLEDKIARFEQLANLEKANDARWGRTE